MYAKLIAISALLLAALVPLAAPPMLGASVSFAPPRSYTVGAAPAAAAVADFNGDGRLDIAVVNGGTNSISILLGNGDGTFQPARNVDVGRNPSSVATGDFDGDGKTDLAVLLPVDSTNAIPGEVDILLSNGDGTFRMSGALSVGLSDTRFVVGDLNGDKKADLVLNHFDSLDVFLGVGDGTFQPPKHVASTPINTSFALTDFNNDGKLDLAMAVQNGVQIRFGTGTGEFGAAKMVFDVDPVVTWLSAANINADHFPDLILDSRSGGCNGFSCNITQHLGVLLSRGDGTFNNEQIFAQGAFSRSFFRGSDTLLEYVATGDFNGDGILDVLDRRATQLPGSTIEVRLGRGNGNFAPNDANLDPTLVLPDPGAVLAFADLNGDQLTDLIVLDPVSTDAIDVVLNATPIFILRASAKTLSVGAGQQVTDKLSLQSVNGFSAAIKLSCQLSGPAPLPTCSFSPLSTPTGAGPSTAIMTIDVPAISASIAPRTRNWFLRRPLALGVFIPLLGFCFVPCGGKLRTRFVQLLLLAIAMLLCGSCGGGSNPAVAQVKSYSITVTAASDSVTRKVQIGLNVD